MAERVLELDQTTEQEGPPALLTRHTTLIEAGLRRGAMSGRSQLGRMSAYHMGWAAADGSPAIAGSGKRVRPALCLWGCEALGGEPEWALPAAVAVELIHNFTLVHDDIQDGDRMRRHRPTVWAIFSGGSSHPVMQMAPSEQP